MLYDKCDGYGPNKMGDDKYIYMRSDERKSR